jgi:hypothetical protein
MRRCFSFDSTRTGLARHRVLGGAVFGSRFGKRNAAIGAVLVNIALYPVPYVLLLIGWWPELGNLDSRAVRRESAQA